MLIISILILRMILDSYKIVRYNVLKEALLLRGYVIRLGTETYILGIEPIYS